jgi:two-component system cell cycle sensor histidine kinase/response regulator CckA
MIDTTSEIKVEQLFSISNQVSEIDDLATLLSFSLEKAFEFTDLDWACVGLVEENGRYTIYDMHGLQQEKDLVGRINDSFLQSLRQPDASALTNQVNTTHKNGETHANLNGSAPLFSCFPLAVNDKFLGTLYCERSSIKGPFQKAELDILTFVAGQTAVSIHKKHLVKTLIEEKQKTKELESEVRTLQQNQQALLESEATYATLVENAHDGVTILQDTTFKFANQAALDIVGYTIEEIGGLKFNEVIAPESASEMWSRYQRRLAGENVTNEYEATFLHKNGERRSVELSAERIQYQGRPAVMAIFRDITERKQAQQALEQSQERLLRFMNGATESFTIWDANMCLVDCNQITLQYLPPDTNKEDILGIHFLHFFPAAKTQGRFQDYLDVVETGNPIHLDHVVAASQIGDRIFDLRAFKVGEGLGLITTDITDQKHTELQVRTLTRAVEQSKMVVMITDDKGDIEYVNPRFTELTQYEAAEVIGKNPRFLNSGQMPIGVFTQMWETIKSGNEWYGELLNRKKNGETYWLVGSMSPVQNSKGQITHYLAITEDITERKEFEEQMRRHDRLAAVGQLAAGIAHDFNNILAVITLYSDMMLRSEQLPEKAKKFSQSILQQSQRAGDLIQQILDFSRQSTLQRLPVELSTVLKDMVKLLQRTLPENIHVAIRYDSDSYQIRADLTRIHQVFMNLAVNARDALPQGGQLSFTLEKIQKEKFTVVQDADDVDCWICVSVSDNGLGMDEETLDHLFEPFYTTKEPGKGTGLGLAQVYGIVKQHGGHICVESEIGHGTTFKIYLPALTVESSPVVIDSETILKMGQGETILVVEDDEATRDAIIQSLDQLDYKTVVAENGQMALEILDTSQDDIDLVLSDVVMPKLGGTLMLEAFQERGIQLPVVMMTGHMMDVTLPELNKYGIVDFLLKPISLTRLSNVLADVFAK